MDYTVNTPYTTQITKNNTQLTTAWRSNQEVGSKISHISIRNE